MYGISTMPPLPIILDEQAQRLIFSAQRLRDDLVEVKIPGLRGCTGPKALQQRLAEELREDVNRLARELEALQLSVGDQRGERNKRELTAVVDSLKDALASIRKDSRAALLASKRAMDTQARSQREELLTVAPNGKGRADADEKVPEDAVMKASSEVTEALRRTIGVMQGELERSVLTTQILDASTATLQLTSTTHDTLTNIMGMSKQLIRALEKSDWLDRLLIASALVFFFLVVLFIIKQRIVDRGLRIALWWSRFVPDFSGNVRLLDVEKSGGHDGQRGGLRI